VAWAKVSQAEEPKQLSKDRPNCLLAEADETWTLEDGIVLPVRRIEMRLDFEPSITWMVDPYQVDEANRSAALDRPRLVFNRLTEGQLRELYAHEYHGIPLPRPGDRREESNATYQARREERIAAITALSKSVDFAVVIRDRMTKTWMASNYRGKEPKGVFAIIESPAVKHYILGVTPFRITSANLIIQAPARVVFGG